MHRAVLVVDLQRDFCEGGALPAQGTSTLIVPLNNFLHRAHANRFLLVYSQDWHPENHVSFSRQGGPWPAHCVAESVGAELHPDLEVPADALLVRKGQQSDRESYSAFDGTGLETELHRRGILSLAILGLTTEYCVMASALDALACGIHVAVLVDLVRPVNNAAGSEALKMLEARGVTVSVSKEWLTAR